MRRQVKNKEFRKVLEKLGLTKSGTKGGHVKYTKAGLLRPVVFRTTGNVPEFHITSNCRTLGITKEKFFELLDED